MSFTFSVVETIEDGDKNFVTVPNTWLDGKDLLWPQKTKLLRKRRDGIQPEKDWERIQCIVRYSGIADFGAALAKEKELLYESTSEPDDNTTRKKKHQESYLYEDLNFNDMITSLDNQINVSQNDFEATETTLLNASVDTMGHITIHPETAVSSINYSYLSSQDKYLPVQTENSNLVIKNVSVPPKTVETNKTSYLLQPQLNTDNNSSSESASSRLDSLEKKINIILSRLDSIENKFEYGIGEIKVTLDAILNKLDKSVPFCEDTPITEIGVQFPLLTREGLEEFEQKLRNEPSFKSNIIKTILRFGGATDFKMARATSTYFFSDKLLENYSWAGTPTKLNFSSFREISLTIVNAIRSRFKDYSEYRNAVFFKEYLKHSKFRNQRNCKSNTTSDTTSNATSCNKL